MDGMKFNENLLEINLSDFFRIDAINWIDDFESEIIGIDLIYSELVDLSRNISNESKIG